MKTKCYYKTDNLEKLKEIVEEIFIRYVEELDMGDVSFDSYFEKNLHQEGSYYFLRLDQQSVKDLFE